MLAAVRAVRRRVPQATEAYGVPVTRRTYLRLPRGSGGAATGAERAGQAGQLGKRTRREEAEPAASGQQLAASSSSSSSGGGGYSLRKRARTERQSHTSASSGAPSAKSPRQVTNETPTSTSTKATRGRGRKTAANNKQQQEQQTEEEEEEKKQVEPAIDLSKTRCGWPSTPKDEAVRRMYVQYHDTEWGVPVHDDRLLFEYLSLEGAQAGLSWVTILKKRQSYRHAFANFDIDAVAQFDGARVNALLEDPGIVRHKPKIQSVVNNARCAQQVRAKHGSLSSFLWAFVEHKPKISSTAVVLTTSPEAIAMSKALKALGFSFVGPTIIYAFMQAVGMVNDHQPDCFRHPANQPATSAATTAATATTAK